MFDTTEDGNSSGPTSPRGSGVWTLKEIRDVTSEAVQSTQIDNDDEVTSEAAIPVVATNEAATGGSNPIGANRDVPGANRSRLLDSSFVNVCVGIAPSLRIGDSRSKRGLGVGFGGLGEGLAIALAAEFSRAAGQAGHREPDERRSGFPALEVDAGRPGE